MRRHHTGSGRSTTTVIPPDWQAQHAGAVAATYDSHVTIGSGAAPTRSFDPTTGQTTTTLPDPAYDGPAAIAVLSRFNQLLDVVDEQDSTRLYEISLPVSAAEIPDGVVVLVVDDPDPMLVGRVMRVQTVQRGTRRFSRIIHAVLVD